MPAHQHLIVCDDFVGDPLTDIAAEIDGHGKPEYILLSDFLAQEGYTYDSDEADLELTGSEPSASGFRILDRVVELSPKTVEKIGKGEGLLQRGQILARYQSLLAKYGVDTDGRRYSTVGHLHPLPTQWHIVDKANLGVTVPAYVYGYGPTPVDAGHLEAPIFKSPFDLYSWKAGDGPPDDELIWDQFATETPAGVPVLTYFLGSVRAMHVLKDSPDRPSQVTLRSLFDKMGDIAELFGHPLTGECLWYIDGKKIVFAAFSHFLSGAGKSETFKPNAELFFREYFG